MPYQSRPDADGLAGRDAERVEQQHEQTFADAEPRERDRQHLGRRHRGHEREHRRVRHRDAEGVDGAAHRDHAPTAGRRSRRRARSSACAGLAADAVDAHVHRADEAHPVLRAWRSGRPGGGWPATHEDHDAARRPWRRRSRARSTRGRRSSSDGSIAKPTSVRSGSATKPLRRSMTTDANAMSLVPVVLRGAADAQDVAADGRRQHVADELAGEVVRRAGCAAARARRTPRTPAATARPTARSRRA